MKYTEIPVKVDKTSVLHFLDCYENSPLFDEISEEYEVIKKKVLGVIRPRAAVSFRGQEAYVLMTLGAEVSQLITQLFEEGEYMGGMLADTIADHCLFSVDDYLTEELRPVCAELRLGVSKRMDAPEDMPMERQNDILIETNGKEELSVGITSGLMFDPVKSQGYILKLTGDKDIFEAGHDCTKCSAVNCKMRKAPKRG